MISEGPDPPFTLHNCEMPAGPVLLAVPHAGRAYPPALLSRARIAPADLCRLEDRFVDLLARPLIAAGRSVLIAHHPRASIDLNRSETEVDPDMVEGLSPRGLTGGAKVRGGLGLVPRRIPGLGDIWRGRLPRAELDRRIATVHRPYHDHVAATLQRMQRRFGNAVLIDLHSMPPLGAGRPQLVLGDRFGASAGGRMVDALEAVARCHGVSVGRNSPYPGGHVLARHGAPRQGRHAIQVEVDRSLYLCDRLVEPGPGLQAMTALVGALVEAAEAEAGGALLMAAE